MMNKHAYLSSILTIIGSIIFFLWSIFYFIIWMISPVRNFAFWASYIFVFLMIAIVGIVFALKVKRKATTVQGVILIIISVPTLVCFGGIFYLIAGIQTLLARDKDGNNQTVINN